MVGKTLEKNTDNKVLEVKDLCVTYGAVQAVRNVGFSVESGQMVVMLGANGAGKTSTLKAVSGQVKSSGSILFMGQELQGKHAYQIARMGMNISPEGRQIFAELTVEENLRAGGYVLNKKDLDASLSDVFANFPILKERRRQQAGTLSGGEQQMLAIGRAMMPKPKLLILDEPSLGLAPLIIKDIFNSLRRICDAGTTVLMVEQNARAALQIADYAYVMELGNIVMSGNSKDLLGDKRLIEAYLGG